MDLIDCIGSFPADLVVALPKLELLESVMRSDCFSVCQPMRGSLNQEFLVIHICIIINLTNVIEKITKKTHCIGDGVGS